ncbi:MAG: hypothetical protein AAB694_00590 [Patescibacteria group bacterium]
MGKWAEGGIRVLTTKDEIENAQDSIRYWQKEIDSLELIKETPNGAYQILIYQAKILKHQQRIKKLSNKTDNKL